MKKAITKRTIIDILIVLCVIVAVWGIPKLYRTVELYLADIEKPLIDASVVIKRYRGRDYYVSKNSFEGEHDILKIAQYSERISEPEEQIPGSEEYVIVERHLTAPGQYMEKEANERPLEEIETTQVMDYAEYVDFCEEWQITQKYTDPDMNYIVRSFYTTAGYIETMLSGVDYNGSAAILYIVEDYSTSVVDSAAHIYTIPTNQDVETVEVVQVYTEEEYENILRFGKP